MVIDLDHFGEQNLDYLLSSQSKQVASKCVNFLFLTGTREVKFVEETLLS